MQPTIDTLPKHFQTEIQSVQRRIIHECQQLFIPASGEIVGWALRGTPLPLTTAFRAVLHGGTMDDCKAAVRHHLETLGPIPHYKVLTTRDATVDSVGMQLWHKGQSLLGTLRVILPDSATEDPANWKGLITFAHEVAAKERAAADAAEAERIRALVKE